MLSFDEQLNLLIRNALQEDIGDGDHSVFKFVFLPEPKERRYLRLKKKGYWQV
jgi:hypothetical protein